MTKYCIECGSKLKKGHKFCRRCGAKISEEIPENIKHCPDCGNEIKKNHKFCDSCGFKLPEKIEFEEEIKETRKDFEEDFEESDDELEQLYVQEKEDTGRGWLPKVVAIIFAISSITLGVILLIQSQEPPFLPDELKADFSYSITGGTIYCYDKSTAPYGSITTWRWDFGDGYILVTDSENTNHEYRKSGSYTVELTVTDNNGKTDSCSEFVRITVPNI